MHLLPQLLHRQRGCVRFRSQLRREKFRSSPSGHTHVVRIQTPGQRGEAADTPRLIEVQTANQLTSQESDQTGYRAEVVQFATVSQVAPSGLVKTAWEKPMESAEMKRLYLEHRKVEEARDLDSVVATFDDDCFLENVTLGTRASGRAAVRKSYEALFQAFPDLSPDSLGEAYGDDVFVTWGTVHGTMDGPWLGLEPTHKSFAAAFVNVVPFRNGRMQGEQIFFDIPALCRGAGVSVDEVIARAAATQQS